MTEHAIIPGRKMGYFEGELEPVRFHAYQKCPLCGALMSERAQRCVQCYGVESTERQVEAGGLSESKMDNHHRFEAALVAGWTEALLLTGLPYSLPSWEEICARDPGAVIRWHPEMVIQIWWETGFNKMK